MDNRNAKGELEAGTIATLTVRKQANRGPPTIVSKVSLSAGVTLRLGESNRQGGRFGTVRTNATKTVKHASSRSRNGARAYKSPALAAIHENMADLHEAGAIEAKTMREFDRACLTPIMTLTPAAIRRIREKEAISHKASSPADPL
jgi:hypothetical protein